MDVNMESRSAALIKNFGDEPLKSGEVRRGGLVRLYLTRGSSLREEQIPLQLCRVRR